MGPRADSLKLLIVDDHLMIREGLRMLLESQPAMTVIGMASNSGEALELAKRTAPDLILLDLDLVGEDGLSALTKLCQGCHQARVLTLTAINDQKVHREAVRRGALGVVLKEHGADVLMKAIEKVNAGEVWLDRSTTGSLLREMTNHVPDEHENKMRTLSARERQVVSLIAEGLRNKQIAERLFISETTVTHHLSSIFSKLEVSDRLELVIYAFGHNLAKVPK